MQCARRAVETPPAQRIAGGGADVDDAAVGQTVRADAAVTGGRRRRRCGGQDNRGKARGDGEHLFCTQNDVLG
jgi:hypothetical protein